MNKYQMIFKRTFIFVQLFLIAIILTLPIYGAGEVDPTFNVNVEKVSTELAYALALQPDGKILVGGNFNSANGLPRSNIARFNSDGSVDGSFNASNIPNGGFATNRVITLQSDGKILIGDDLTSISGVTRYRLARLNPNGSLDNTFLASGINGTISAIAVQPDGKILVGGSISSFVNNQSMTISGSNLMRFNADGSYDSTFDLNPPSNVADIALQPDGKILIGGGFGFVARVNPNGSVDSTFANLSIQGGVNSIVLQPDGKVIIGGSFSSVGGVSRGNIARLNSDGTLDTTFNAGNSGTNSIVSDIALASDGKIVIVGLFTSYNGVARRRLAGLNADGSLDTSFNFSSIPTGLSPNSVVIQPDGKIIIAGTNNSLSQPGSIFRLNRDGSVDTSFSAYVTVSSSGAVFVIKVLPDGKTLVAGNFFIINGIRRIFIARLNTDGTVDPGFVPAPSIGTGVGGIYTIAVQTDGKILIGGELGNNIQRLNTDGSKDTTFNPPVAIAGVIRSIAIQPDGKILVPNISTSGSFNSGILRLNADGSVDTTYSVNVESSSIQKIVIQPDGKAVVSGGFQTVNGVSRRGIARLNTDGSTDLSFNPPFGVGVAGQVFTLALQSDGKILAGGLFTSVNGVSRNNLARFNTDGSLDSSFAPNPSAQVQALFVQPDGKILVGGVFTVINGVTRNRYARLNADGAVDTSFNPGIGANDGVLNFDLQLDGKILIGGYFTQIGGQLHIGLARLFNSSAAGRTLFDFDGDGKADLSVFRPSNGFWYELRSQNNSLYALQFGQSTDKLAPADYDGDGRTDITVFRENVPGAGDKAYFYITNSSDNTFRFAQFGTQGDLPMSGDWDGDGKADLAVYREAAAVGGQSFFYYRPSSQSGVDFRAIAWGTRGDKPVRGDFDGDGKLDAAVVRPSNATWYILQSSNGQIIQQQFGLSTDIPTPADYNGDGKTNIAVFRPSNGFWYTSTNPQTNFGAVQFGAAGDLPVPADYDGDGRADVAVFRPSNGVWYLLRSTAGFTGIQFGAMEDRPIPNAYIR